MSAFENPTPNPPGDTAGSRLHDMNWFHNVLRFIGLAGGVVIVVAGLQAFPCWQQMLRCVGLALAAGCASVMVGAGFGFLFGIPRTLQSSAAPRPKDPKDTAPEEDQNARAGVAGNTNLERVSDWLTGMLVGAGLVELERLKYLFLKLVDALAKGFSGGTTRESFAYALALCLVPYFLVSGFLVGYILTRRYLPRTFLSAEIDAQQVQRRENRLLAMVMRAVSGMVGPAAVVTPKAQEPTPPVAGAAPPPESPQPPVSPQGPAAEPALAPPVPQRVVEEAKSAVPAPPAIVQGESSPPAASISSMAKSAIVANDPNKGKFGRQAERNGRRLSAKVQALNEGVSEFFRVTLEVRSTDPSRPLQKPVSFSLHPTFARPRETVTPCGGVATLELIVWGSFTVGVVTDDGATSLELDLAELPGVPDYFRDR